MGWRTSRRSDVDQREEILAHIRIEADRLIGEGVPAREAMQLARARFGEQPMLDPTSRRRLPSLDVLGADIRQAVRQLKAAPLSTATILASLVIGIGASTAIFSLADQVLLRPLPVSDPDGVVQLSWSGEWIGEGRGRGSLLPHPLYEELKMGQEVFRSIAARSPGEATLISPAGPERTELALVTGTFFQTMGLRPHLGRLIDEGDDEILDGHPVAVLSHRYWMSRYSGSPAVVGQQLRINGQPMTVIGVAPEGFYGTDWSVVPSVWVPMMMNGLIHEWGRLDQPRVAFQHIYARLAPGITRHAAEASIQPWFRRYLRVDMERPDWPTGRDDSEISAYLNSRLAVQPGGQGQAARAGELTQPMLVLSAATAMLLLLACLNVANLSLARAVARYRDTAVRSALGAARTRILAERFVESALLAFVGGTIGVMATPWVRTWILYYLEIGGTGMALDAGLDGRTLLTAVGVAVVATILCGVGPAWYASSTQPMGALRSARTSSGVRLRQALVVAQVALALVLLMGAGLFGSTLRTLRATGPGFPTDQLISFSVTPANDGFSPPEAMLLLEDIRKAVGNIPGIDAAGYAAWPLLSGGGWGNPMLVEGDTRFVTDLSLPMNAVTPGFFEVLGVDIRQGRDFDSRDRTAGDDWLWESVIVSQSFVDRYLSEREPVGTRIDFGRDPSASARMEIVGVVEDYAEHNLRDPLPQVYFPILAQVRRGGTFYLRSHVSLSEVRSEIRARTSTIGSSLTISEIHTVDDQIDRLLVFERMLSSLGAAFAVFGALLAMIGIYGVLSFMVQSRTKEIGIRMALGAPRSSAARLVVGGAMRLTLLGVAGAMPTIWLLGGLIESQLYGVRAMNPVGLLFATLAILAICLIASLVPARRMAMTDPLEALRVE